MDREIVTFNGYSINDGTNFHTTILEQTQAAADPLLIARTDNVPVYAGKRHQGKSINMVCQMRGNIGLQIGTLNKAFDVYDKTPRELLIQDAANGNKQWYLSATTYRQPEWSGQTVDVTLMAADPVWRSKTVYGGTAAISTSPGTLTVTPGGNQPAYPTILLTPTGAKGTAGYSYKRWVPIYNRTAYAVRDAWNLTDNGSGTAVWNTGTVVAGSMQATGNDLRVYIDNVEVNRWLYAVGSADTRVWAVVPLSPKVEFSLAAIAGTGSVGTMTVQATNANLLALKRLPDSGILLIDSEAVSYTGVNHASLASLSVVVGARGIRGTTGATHAAAATARWIEHDIWLLYGNTSAAAPEVDNTEQPVFSNSESNNVLRAYYQFADDQHRRAGSWQDAVLYSSGKQSYTYTGVEDAGDGTAADSMGLAMLAWQNGTRWQSENARIEWRFNHPCGITACESSGEKWNLNVTGTHWPALVALQKSPNGVTWTNVWNQGGSAPGTAATWQTWSNNYSWATQPYIRFYMAGALGARAENAARFEVGIAKVTLGTAGIPCITMGPQISNYHLSGTITNTTTGDALKIDYPMTVGGTLTINTDRRTVTYGDSTSALGARSLSSVRQDWLALLPGTANVLTFADATLTGLSMIVRWEDRST